MMNCQEIQLIARRQHLRQVEVVEVREGLQRVRMVITAGRGISEADSAIPSMDSALRPVASQADRVTVRSGSLGLLRLAHPLRSLSGVASGDIVVAGQPLALLEVHGVYTDVVTPCDGVVVDVLAADGDRVDFGMPLFTLKVSPR
ncbi:MAG: hypothetical protein A2Z90_14270 [Burkholderiales bacterium GWA2_64_37]|nr:MAG: hypothetical protein A2Z90_14270 [Burkholderiales bacterium GWA2_64_37]